jgi:hypothetical protein
MKEEYASFEIEIIRALFRSDTWVDSFILHEKYMLSPGQLAHAVRKLLALEIVEMNGLSLRLNDKGRKWVFANRRALFMRGDRRFWATRQDRGPGSSLSPWVPYMPKLNALRPDFFRKR